MTSEALAGLVFGPLLAACALILIPRRWAKAVVPVVLIGMPVLLIPITSAVLEQGTLELALAGFSPPLGIAWRVDALSLVLLWLSALVLLLVGVHALTGFPPGGDRGGHFWPLWLVLTSGMNAALLSADLFNLYVTLELITLAGIGLIAINGQPAALRAAMRYLLLALMASLLYLLGVGLVYGQTGTLDLLQAGQAMEPELLPVTAMVLMMSGLLLKSAIFPLHIWLPAAHGNAPGPVSAVLSALMVKVSIYIAWRLWFWMVPDWDLPVVALLLGLLGAGAIIYGSLLAMLARRLKMVIAYSTVAQLGYLMLVFPLASALAFKAATYHLIAHGLAKAALFLAAANILAGLGTDRLRQLPGLDQRMPLEVFTLALAGVSIMGLPPSGGFIGKWLLLEAAWEQAGWGWMLVIALGGLLAAGYVFRVLALTCFHPRTQIADFTPERASRIASLVALGLAVLAIVAGFASAPILALLETGLPEGLAP